MFSIRTAWRSVDEFICFWSSLYIKINSFLILMHYKWKWACGTLTIIILYIFRKETLRWKKVWWFSAEKSFPFLAHSSHPFVSISKDSLYDWRRTLTLNSPLATLYVSRVILIDRLPWQFLRLYLCPSHSISLYNFEKSKF